MRISPKIFIVFLFLGLLMVRPSSSYAYWHDGWHGHGYVNVNLGVWPGPYYDPYYAPYYAPYYDPYYAAAPVVVSSSSYQPVLVNGVTYYVNNGVYYIYTQYGYQAVASPVGASVPAVQATPVTVAAAPVTVTAGPASAVTDDTYNINIPNSKGGYNSVTIKRSGNGFVGPQGEFYADFPKVSQLQVMYGK